MYEYSQYSRATAPASLTGLTGRLSPPVSASQTRSPPRGSMVGQTMVKTFHPAPLPEAQASTLPEITWSSLSSPRASRTSCNPDDHSTISDQKSSTTGPVYSSELTEGNQKQYSPSKDPGGGEISKAGNSNTTKVDGRRYDTTGSGSTSSNNGGEPRTPEQSGILVPVLFNSPEQLLAPDHEVDGMKEVCEEENFHFRPQNSFTPINPNATLHFSDIASHTVEEEDLAPSLKRRKKVRLGDGAVMDAVTEPIRRWDGELRKRALANIRKYEKEDKRLRAKKMQSEKKAQARTKTRTKAETIAVSGPQ